MRIVAAMVTAVMLAAGCSGGSSPATQPSRDTSMTTTTRPAPDPTIRASDIRVVDRGYGTGQGYGWAAAILRNRSKLAASVDVSFAFYDRRRILLGSGEGEIGMLRSHQSLGVGVDTIALPAGADIARMRVTVSLGATEADDNPRAVFAGRGVRFRPGAVVDTVTGEVSNPYRRSISDVLVYVICFAPGGEMDGYGFDFADGIPAHGRVPLSVDMTAVDGTPDHCAFYPAPRHLI